MQQTSWEDLFRSVPNSPFSTNLSGRLASVPDTLPSYFRLDSGSFCSTTQNPVPTESYTRQGVAYSSSLTGPDQRASQGFFSVPAPPSSLSVLVPVPGAKIVIAIGVPKGGRNVRRKNVKCKTVRKEGSKGKLGAENQGTMSRERRRVNENFTGRPRPTVAAL